MIEAEDAFAQMGADVMRWQYCAQPPDRNLLFGFGPAHEIKRKLLTFWNSTKFLVDYANIEGFAPSWAQLEPDGDLRPLDRWLVARTQQLVAEATDAYEATLTVDVIRAFEAFVDDVSNWYIRRSRRRFYSYDEAAFRTLWYALVQSLRVIAPVMPFLDRPPLAEPRPGRARRRCTSRRWPEAERAGPRAARRDRRGAARRRARPAGAVGVAAEAAPAAAAARRRGRGRRRARARRRDRRRAARQGGRVRRGRGVGAAREAEPAGARAEARRGAARRARAAAARRVRGARRRPLPGRRPRARARRGARRARRASRAGRSRARTASPSRSTRRSTTSCGSKAASSTGSAR